ncbi:MAG: SDR family oxidoreductase [Deltaproteobacteria bacterium]|nr:SDR family oxidoreductase [Deltaproteobacteria bacterium]
MEVVRDKIALLVGACDEVGQAIGVRLAQKGATVIVCDTDYARLSILAEQIRESGGNAEANPVDSTSSVDVKRLVGDVIKQYGKIDILINNADARFGKPVGDASDEEWETGIRTNLNPVFFFCREVIPKMQAQKYGRVINISSLDYIGWPGRSSYSAVKSALFGLTRSLSLETARDGVTVNCVARGDVATSEMSPELAAKIGESLPVKRIGRPDDVARAVGFFASDWSNYVTGQMFFVCGGKSAHFSMSI